jgi:glucose-6-phosphate-specific signal transduction histidine kinase
MFLPAIMLDDKGAIESLRYSHGLVWGNWWRTAAIATIALIIVYVIFVIVGVLAGMAFMLTGVDPVAIFLVQVLTTLVGGILMTPFFVALFLEIYRDLKMRKLGSDLAARIEGAGVAR